MMVKSSSMHFAFATTQYCVARGCGKPGQQRTVTTNHSHVVGLE